MLPVLHLRNDRRCRFKGVGGSKYSYSAAHLYPLVAVVPNSLITSEITEFGVPGGHVIVLMARDMRVLEMSCIDTDRSWR
jgi:hypothetical protein